jgi:phage-related protein
VTERDKPLVWLRGEIKTPPFSSEARLEAGVLLRRLQRGEKLGMPQSRPLPAVGPGCHELRVPDWKVVWRILYHVAPDAIVVLEVFQKKSRTTPKRVIEEARRRLRAYLKATEDDR